jgi:parvulin-like peptidyl-prolyl isomerase
LRQRWFKALALVLVAVFVTVGCTQKPIGKVLATVNGDKVTESQYNERLQIYQLFYNQALDGDHVKDQVLSQLIEEKIIEQEAKKRNLKPSEDAATKELKNLNQYLENEQLYGSKAKVDEKLKELKLTRKTLEEFVKTLMLGQALFDDFSKSVVLSDEEIQNYYSTRVDQYYSFDDEVVSARHILVSDENKAKDLAAQAKGGADFAELARKNSEDSGSAPQGGYLGYFTADRMVKPFSQAAFAMKPGDISDPVQSEFGWHVIKVEDRREAGIIPFEEVKEDVREKALAEKKAEEFSTFMEDLKGKASITKTEPEAKKEGQNPNPAPSDNSGQK